ncbi:MAG: 30S ribosome-binding factor RbfA [Eubacteriales bacterium]
MANYRMEKVNHDIQRILSEIIRDDVNDPNVDKMCSVMKAEVTKDLKYAKAYISVFGDEDKNKKTVDALNKAAGFIKHRLSEIMKTKSVPTVKFLVDNSIRYSIEIAQKLEDIEHEQ